jgi:hypothetical protein
MSKINQKFLKVLNPNLPDRLANVACTRNTVQSQQTKIRLGSVNKSYFSRTTDGRPARPEAIINQLFKNSG